MLSSKNIKLSTRTALLFCGGLFLIISLSVSLTWFFFLREINDLELDETIQTNQQAQQTIQIKLEDMARRSADWAFWDESYKLTTQGDSSFHERNLNADSLKNNDTDLMLFLSRRGEFVDGARLNAAQDTSLEISPVIIKELISERGIGRQLTQVLHTSRPDLQPIAGIISLWNDPMLITLTPITAGNTSTDIGGWLIWAKRIHLFFPERYAKVLMDNTQLLNIAPSALPPAINAALLTQQKRYMHLLSDDEITVFSTLNDINQQPVAIIENNAPRSYYQSGRHALYVLAISCLFSGILISLLFFHELRRTLGERLHTLESGLKRLVQDDFTELLHTDDGKDEISMVSQVVNKLLTTKLATNDALEEVENKLSAIYENANQPMLIAYENRILSANFAAATLLGYDNVSDLAGLHMGNLLNNSNQQTADNNRFYQQIRDGNHKFEWDIVGHLGWLVPCELDITPIDHQGQQALLVCMNDISERRLHENKIRRLVFNDALTGLFNRYALIQRMQPVLDHLHDDERFALLYINIDRFRAINDTFGHDVGDGVIKMIALRLSMQCETLTLARIAGDEFIVFIPTILNSYQPIRLGHDIQRLLLQPLIINGVSLDISTTLSVIIGSTEYTMVEDVLRCADFAMSRAKKQNKRIQIFSHRMYQEAIETLAIQRDLPTAIRNQQIKPVFQPIVSCITGEIIGFEALARWHHPDLGHISPVRFIPMAEESNLIVELGEQVLAQSCQFIQKFNQIRTQQKQPRLSVHVNFSAHHFSSSTLLDNLRSTLEQNTLDPQFLVIEITESMLIDRPTESVKRMAQIKALGVSLALDDFGTGYSALNTLCQYPLDIVKLDRSFVLRLMDGEQGEVLVRAIVNMARDLKLAMVAEGVETHEQMLKIKALGVEEIQGYYYFRPMPAEDIFALAATTKGKINSA